MGRFAVGTKKVGILVGFETVVGVGFAGIECLLCHDNYNKFLIISAQHIQNSTPLYQS